MAQNDNINLIVTDFEEIKASIINFFKNNPKSKFKDWNFENSGLANLIDVLSYITFYNNYYTAVSVNELYLPYSQLNKNIYALGKTLGYIPKRPTSSTASVKIEIPELNNPDYKEDIVIPIYTILTSQKGLKYITTEEIRFKADFSNLDAKGNPTYTIYKNGEFQPDSYFTIKQGQLQYLRYVPNQQILQRVYLDKNNIDDSPSSLIVQDSVTFEYWKPFYDLSDFDLDLSLVEFDPNKYVTRQDWINSILSTEDIWDNFILQLADSKIYFIDMDEKGLYINFGDNILGQIPTNPLDIYYLLTEGSSGNGDTIFTMEGILDYKRADGSLTSLNLKEFNVTISEGTSSAGGADGESAESVRKLSTSFYNAQNREVIEKDYEVFLGKQKQVSLKNIKCLSGDKLKPVVMAAVGIIANKHTETNDVLNSLLTEEDKTILKYIIKNNNVVTINPIFINPDFVKINLDLKIFYNPLKHEQSSVFNLTDIATRQFFDKLNGFNKYFKSSNLIKILDSIEEIDHSLLTTSLEYVKIIDKKELSNFIFINFGDTNKIIPNSLREANNSNYLVRIFNNNNFYPITSILPPSGTSNFNNLLIKLTNSIQPTVSVIPKIFTYTFLEKNIDENLGKLYLKEYFVKQLQAERINGSNDDFTFKYITEETGKTKYIGDIYYQKGFIKLYLTDVFFKFLEDNKKYRKIALQTIKNGNIVSDYDTPNTGFSSYVDIFFKKYNFDGVLGLPVTYDNISGKYKPNNITDSTRYVLNFAFNNDSTDYESSGNALISLGNVNYVFVKEVNKK